MARYIEFLVRADESDMKAFLAGCAAAAPGLRIVLADEAGFHIRQLRERIRHHGDVEHVIVEATQAPRIRAALAAGAPRYRFEIKEERGLDKAHFGFEFETPSRGVADKIKTLVAHLPAGTALENYQPRERTDPDAAGTEIYTPEHQYSFAGHGTIRGDVFAVVDARNALEAIDFTKSAEIVVDGR